MTESQENAQLPKLQLTEFEAKLAELVEKQPVPARHSARRAVHHLRKAWRIKEIDPEMAYFRSLTAEEEAATAVFRSMKRLKYKGVDQLKDRNHSHKNALVPFAYAVGKVLHLTVTDGFDPKLAIKENGPKAGRLQIRLTIKLPNGEEKHAWPTPPLHFGISLNGTPHDFTGQLQELAAEGKAQDALAYVAAPAPRRGTSRPTRSLALPTAPRGRGRPCRRAP